MMRVLRCIGAMLFALAACGDVAQPSLKTAQSAPGTARDHAAEGVGSGPNMATEPQLVTLTAKLAKSGARLDVHYTIHNGGKTPLLVFDGLWKGGDEREADGQQLYRFVTGDTLNLLLGPAPLPKTSVTYKNLPDVTRVEPYASFEADLSTPLPVTEYNVYFSTARADERVEVQVHKVELFASYVDATGVKTSASKIHPGSLETLSPISGLQTMRSGPIALTVDALRQTGEFERFAPR